jgi:hypothetical protein
MKACVVLTIAALCVALAAAKSCSKAAKQAAKKGKPPPACDGNKFAAVQCPDSCFCADANSGKNMYNGFSFPSPVDFDCSSEYTIQFVLDARLLACMHCHIFRAHTQTIILACTHCHVVGSKQTKGYRHNLNHWGRWNILDLR